MKGFLFFCLQFVLMAPMDSQAQAWSARHGLSGPQYQQAFTQMLQQGYRPTVVSGYTTNSQPTYAAIWEKVNGPVAEYRHGLSAAAYQSTFTSLTAQGFRPVYINGFAANGTDLYNAIFQKTAGPAYVARHGITEADYQKIYTDYVPQGYRPLSISAYTVNGQHRFAGIWEKKAGPEWVARHGLTSTQYQTEFTKFTAQGFRLKCITGYGSSNNPLYAAVWEKMANSPAWLARHGMNGNFYQYQFDNFYYQGYRPIYLNVFNPGNGALFNTLWTTTVMSSGDRSKIDNDINNYMSSNNIPGLAFAVIRQGRLVFAKGYGTANQSTGEPVGPNHRFRIASVSKPMTALGIMTLVEAGKLSLDATVFGSNGILSAYTIPARNNNIKEIKVRHLLNHTSGFRNAIGDPVFMNYNMNHSQLIQWALNNDSITQIAGTAYTYSNFNYILLGRIIEAKSGQGYEQYLRNNVFNKCGVTGMEIGASTQAGRKPMEVNYYGNQGEYGMFVERMDANGGWIASPLDLVRVLARIDRNAGKPDIFNNGSFTQIHTGSGPNSGYGLGFGLSGNGKWHNGAMPGTIAFMQEDGSGNGWAVVCNTRPGADGFCFNLNGIIQNLVNTVAWPGYDLFQ